MHELLEKAGQELFVPENKREYFETELQTIELPNPDLIAIDGTELDLDKRAKGQLCKILEIPAKFYTDLHSKDVDIWSMMVKKLEQIGNKSIRFSLGKMIDSDKQGVFSFNPSDSAWIANEEFLNIAQWILDNSQAKLERVSVWGSILNIEFTFPLTNSVLVESAMINDIFTYGINLKNDQDLHSVTQVRGAIERLVCTNRAVMSEKGYTEHCQHIGTSSRSLINEVYKILNKKIKSPNPIDGFIQRQLKPMTECNASLNELKASWDVINYIEPSLNEDLKINELVPYTKTLKAYNLEDTDDKSKMWMSTASTPIKMYDLYNNMTWIASNHGFIDVEKKLATQIKLGKLFLHDSPNMLDLAPQMNWN